MKLIAVLVAFAVLVVAAAAAFAPATLLDMRLDAATQGQLRLTNAEGSVWYGRALVTNAQRTWSLPVAWKLAPLEFARGGIAVSLRDTGQGGDSRGNFTWRDGTLTAEGVALSVPSSAVSGAMAADNMVALGGALVVETSHFGWSGSGGDGSALLRWSGARMAANAGTISLGTVTANCAPRDNRVQCKVGNSGGDVRIDGEFSWSSAAVDVNAALSALPSAPPAVVRALGTLATPDASGAVRVRWHSGPR